MFSVLVKDKDQKDCSSEWIYSCKAAVMRHGRLQDMREGEAPGLTLFNVNEDDALSVNISAEGSVAYVMNEGGATIATYRM